MKASILDDYLASGGAAGSSAPPPTADVMAAVALLNRADATTQAAATVRQLPTPIQIPTTENGLPVFGLDIFRRATNQFEPNAVGPVDANYRLGPLDVLAVILTGETELSQSPEVTREGFIVIPQVGQIYVANMTLAQATQAIVQKVRQSYAGAGTSANSPTKVYVTVARLRTNQIYVVGEVAAPGSYQVSAAGTALTALYAAGGPTVRGTVRNIEVRRAGKVVSTFDLYAYLLRGDASSDIRLETGDEIFVGSNPKQVSITGEIVRPAIYELKAGETLDQLIGYAGGLKTTAARARVQIARVLPVSQRTPGHERTVIDVLGDPETPNSGAAQTALQPLDAVTVFGITDRVRNRLNITGSVWAPGSLGLRAGMKLSDAIRLAGGLRPDTYLGEVQVTRLLPNEQREQVSVRLDSLGRPVNDIALREDDQIRVFGNSEFRTLRSVSLSGAVRHPVDVAWASGLTVKDLVLQAGGFESESDVINSVTISRLQDDLTRRILVMPLRDRDGQLIATPLDAGDVLRIYSNAEFRLQRPVSITGAVRKPLDVTYQSGMTLRDLILMAGGFETESDVLDTVTVSRIQPDLTRRSLSLALRDSAGGLSAVPLVAGDQIRLFTRSQFRPARNVRVGGAVRSPGAIPYAEGMTLRQAILQSGGLDESALLTDVQISRLPDRLQAGKLAEIITISLDSSYVFGRGADGKYTGPNGMPAAMQKTPEFILKPYDQVNVLRQPEWDFGGSITIGGEVRFPGSYALLRRDETIRDIVNRAGGLTDRAYAAGAVFSRPVPSSEVASRRKLLEQVRKDRAYGITTERVNDKTDALPATVSSTITATENKALGDVFAEGDGASERIALDLPSALRTWLSRDNLIVRSGDELYIPTYNPTVTVRGFIGTPTTLPYRAGMNLRQYVELAGGATINADMSHAIVQQPNGQVEAYRYRHFLPDYAPIPQAGSIIVVPPAQASNGQSSVLQILTAIAGLTTAAAATITVLRR